MTRRVVRSTRTGRTAGTSVLAAAILLCAACSTSQGGSTAASSASAATPASRSSTGAAPIPTLTAPNLQPPKQQNQNRPDVAFDPCTWIDDSTISRLGYASGSRKRGTDIHAEYTFLTCDFQSPDQVYDLSILSGNRTMDEGRQKFTADGGRMENTTIDGRAAMVVRGDTTDTCDVVLQTKAGYVDFLRTIATYKINGPTPEQCSGMVDLVRGVIPRIGDN